MFNWIKDTIQAMQSSSERSVIITSTAFTVFCLFLTYMLCKRKQKARQAADVFKYLNIHSVTTEVICDEVVSELRRNCSQHKALGFDCEWVTEKGRRHPVALVQLSSIDGLCGLFRLNNLKSIPNSLKELLEDESIYKVGVAPGDDAKYLFNDYSVVLKSTLDLRHIAQLYGYEPGGLGVLSKTLLNVELDKSWRIRCSDWEVPQLSDKQTTYAAVDAYVAIKIFVNLIHKYSSRSVLSYIKRNSDNDVASRIDGLCSKYLNIRFKYKKKVTTKNDVIVKNGKRNKNFDNKVVGRRYPHALRSKPLYENCFLVAPDGELLCTSDTKKALWYVEKQLADVVKEDPLTVKLRFEPAGRSVGDVGRYYQLTKENKCVVCGEANTYIRKNVVPREYRKYFPEIMKEHSSHDVVLLCAACHQESNMRDQVVRDKLANMCDAPLSKHDTNRYKEDALCKKVKYAARALLYQSQKHVLPDTRRQELEELVLANYPHHDQITEELLKEAAAIQVLFDNPDYECHGLKVVQYFLEKESLLRLEEIWREHFLTSMNPKYMPELWSVKHNEEKLKVKWNEGRLQEADLKAIGVDLLTWQMLNK